MESETTFSFDDTETAFAYKSNKELRMAYWIFSMISISWLTSFGKLLLQVALWLRLPVLGLVRLTVFKHFCGGENINQTQHAITKLASYEVKTILDYSVEGEDTEEDFEYTMQQILLTIDKANELKDIPFCVFKISGIAHVPLLERIQRLELLSLADQKQYESILNRVNKICSHAHHYGIPILIDAEESWIQGAIDKICLDMMHRYNTEKPIVFNTYQLYRKSALKSLREAFHNAAMHNFYLGVKLVRGAYMEKERSRAEDQKYTDPIQNSKEDTDRDFNEALSFCIGNKQRITVMCGSHNEYSNYYLTVLMEKHGMKPQDKRVWFAQLFGMSDNISFVLAKHGYNVAKYVPFGPVKSVMPYLFRRAEENTAIAGQSSRELRLIKKEMVRRGLMKADSASLN